MHARTRIELDQKYFGQAGILAFTENSDTYATKVVCHICKVWLMWIQSLSHLCFWLYQTLKLTRRYYRGGAAMRVHPTWGHSRGWLLNVFNNWLTVWPPGNANRLKNYIADVNDTIGKLTRDRYTPMKITCSNGHPLPFVQRRLRPKPWPSSKKSDNEIWQSEGRVLMADNAYFCPEPCHTAAVWYPLQVWSVLWRRALIHWSVHWPTFI